MLFTTGINSGFMTSLIDKILKKNKLNYFKKQKK